MKRKIITLFLLTTMMVTLVACGGTTNTSNTPTSETQEDTQVSQNETQQQETNEEEIFSDDMSWKFPSGMEGFTDKWIYADDETWSYNQTHYVAKNGNVMNFMWNGPTELGESASAGETTLELGTKTKDYKLIAWLDILSNEEDWLKNAPKENILSWVNSVSYNENGLYEICETSNGYKAIFEVSNAEYYGYACFIDDYNTLEAYQFIYLEKKDIYDDTRAMKVINSLDFWDYEE